MFGLRRRQASTTKVRSAKNAPNSAPTQSPDSVHAQFDDTVTELATSVAAKITEKNDTSQESFEVPINISDHPEITPWVVAVKAVALAKKKGVRGTFTMQSGILKFIPA